MNHNPLDRAQYIEKEFKDYLKSSFSFKDDEINDKFQIEIENAEIYKGPYLNIKLPFCTDSNINTLIENGYLHEEFYKILHNDIGLLENRELYTHQVEAIKKINSGKSIVISTGTGSGKTESFLYSIINSILLEDNTINRPGIRALFLYPMNALVNDQMDRIRELLKDYPQIRFGLYTGENKDAKRKKTDLKNEMITRKEIQDNPPHILFTNYSMLEYLLIRPSDSHMFLNSKYLEYWRFIVLDEAHTYRGAAAIEMSLLLRRVVGMAPQEIQFILTSATLGKANDRKGLDDIVTFAQNLTNRKFTVDDIIFAKYKDIGLNGNGILTFDQLSKLEEMILTEGKIINVAAILQNTRIVKDIFNYLEIPKTYNQLMKYLKVNDKYLSKMIDLIVKCNAKTKTLYDIKYHSFVRGLDGAYMTFNPKTEIKLTRHTEINNLKAFEIGTCKYCSTIYIIGKVTNNKLIQNMHVDIYENYSECEYENKVDYFIVKRSVDNSSKIDEYDDEEFQEYALCNKCGHIYNKNEVNPDKCNCGLEYVVNVFKVDDKYINSTNVNKCLVCGNSSNKSGIVQSFNVGKDQATALLGQMLYETLDEDAIYPKFIAFSDGRQQASHFASFFKYNHDRFLRKRLLFEVIKQNNNESMEINFVLNSLEKLIIDKRLITNANGTAKSLSWLTVLYDLLYVDGKNGGEGLGLYCFKLNFDSATYDREIISEFAQQFNLTTDEYLNFARVVLDVFRYYPAIEYTSSLSSDDLDVLEYRSMIKEVYYSNKCAFGNNKYSAANFRSSYNNNKIENYTKRICNDKFNQLLESVWEFCNQCGMFNVTPNEGRRIHINKYKFQEISDFYVCPVCGKTTVYNVKGVCPTKDCPGKLNKINPNKYFENNYYRKKYTNKRIEKVVAKEHTGQISIAEAKKYQNEFNNNEINLLSSSTTFEMGLDIDSLSTVFMRNVPPLPSNYVQRAGRAGRQAETSAFILTYCSTSSHDYTFFKAPLKMIAGEIMPPYFSIANEKIILRHLLASSLGFYFRIEEYKEYYRTVNKFIESLDNFIMYMKSKPKELTEYLDEKVIPQELKDKYKKMKWLDFVNYGAVSYLMQYKSKVLESIEEYEKSKQEAIINENYKEADINKKIIANIRDEELINGLSRNGIIPKHGFPVDVVSLLIKNKDSYGYDNSYNLNRDLHIAISEYAPESEVVVKNNIYKSRYVNMQKDKPLKKYTFYQCENCNHIHLKQQILHQCDRCGQNVERLITPFVIPKFGFTTDGNKKNAENSKKPQKTYSGEIVYLNKGVRELGPQDFMVKDNQVTVETFIDDELLVINDSKFYMCNECGYTVIDDKKRLPHLKKKHKTKYNQNCNGDLYPVSLGAILRTDATKIRLIFKDIDYFELRRKSLSLLYSLIEGVSHVFEIERTDINGVISDISTVGEVDIIIYDNVPGGAGHSKRLYDTDILNRAFHEAYNIVNKCCCDINTSCYNCLRNYYNQKNHDWIRRSDALELLEMILG